MMILTIIAVNLDAYVAGIALGNGSVKTPALLYISLYSFILPLVGMLVFSVFPVDVAGLNVLCACILILLGIRGLLSGKEDGRRLLGERASTPNFVELTLMGISLSPDNVLGALAFVGDGRAVVLPLLMFAAQFCMLSAGSVTAGMLGVTRTLSRIAGALLILLGAMRLI